MKTQNLKYLNDQNGRFVIADPRSRNQQIEEIVLQIKFVMKTPMAHPHAPMANAHPSRSHGPITGFIKFLTLTCA